MKKLHSLDQLTKILNVKRQEGKRIVLANGVFDLFHVGHIRYLKGAKEKGDILVVALNSDSSVRKLKGPGRPLLTEDERSEIMASFYFVDYVIIFNEENVNTLLRTLKPDVHAKGSDYTKETVPESDTVIEYGGEIAITGGAKVRSSTDLFRSIAALQDRSDLN